MGRTEQDSVDAYIAEQPETMREMVAELRTMIRDEAPAAVEAVKWGHPTYGQGPDVCYVSAFTRHVNLGFFRGAELDDPEGLLEGSGKRLRHVKLRPGEPWPRASLRALVREAFELER